MDRIDYIFTQYDRNTITNAPHMAEQCDTKDGAPKCEEIFSQIREVYESSKGWNKKVKINELLIANQMEYDVINEYRNMNRRATEIMTCKMLDAVKTTTTDMDAERNYAPTVCAVECEGTPQSNAQNSPKGKEKAEGIKKAKRKFFSLRK